MAPVFLHKGQCGVVEAEGQAIGFIGILHPELLDENKIRASVGVLEIEIGNLLEKSQKNLKAQMPSKFPSVERDLALVMASELSVGEITKVIRHKVGALLADLKVIDVFEGGTLESGKKSVTVRLVLQDKEATLQEEQINALQQKLLEELKTRYSIALR